MEKRILLAFILSFGVLYAFRALYAPAEVPLAPPVVGGQTTPTPEPAVENNAPPPPSAPAVPTVTAAPQGDIQAETAEEFVIDTALYTAKLSNVGGVLTSYALKAYRDAEGRPIELIDDMGGTALGWPLAIVTGDQSVDDALSKANFVGRRDAERIEMEFAANGVYAHKSVEFDPRKFEFRLTSAVTRGGAAIPHSVVWRGGFGDQSVPTNDPTLKNVVYETAGEFERINIAGIEEPQEVTTARVGIEDQYFLAMFLLPKASTVKIERQDYTEGEETSNTASLTVPLDPAQPTRVYVGPKDETWLAETDPALPAVIDYGFFAVIARPMIRALLWLNTYIGNFGWSIIVLTVIINFVLLPLRLKQQVSMQKMQKIQPQMRTLQDRYKKLKANDPRRAQVQTEMMSLYKEHGVNPMGGCLPLLLQIPFFAAIWTMLSVSIELRQAPWILWIRDLSQYDPYYVLPILMAVSMVIMQKMTPTTVDPAQARIMMIMPLVFAVMFLQAQAGLTLYWLTSNGVGIGQQYLMNKYWTPATEAKSEAGPKRREPRAQ